jgi:hypothetical protein
VVVAAAVAAVAAAVVVLAFLAAVVCQAPAALVGLAAAVSGEKGNHEGRSEPMLDALVKITSVKDTVGLDPTTLLPTRNKVVTFNVGTWGPFTLTTPAQEYSEEYVRRETQREVDTLRAIGAIT